MKLVLGFILNPRNFEIRQRNLWVSSVHGKEGGRKTNHKI